MVFGLGAPWINGYFCPMQIFALIQTMRPVNGLITFAGAFLGNALVPVLTWEQTLYLALGLFAIVSYGNVDNDLCDLETDRINRPSRPLVRGTLSLGFARSGALVLVFGGLFLLYQASFLCLVQGLLALPILWIYNRFLKRLPFLGNWTVGALCAWSIFTPHFPSLPTHVLPAVLFALVLTVVREMIKDAEDLEGDQRAGMQTTAVLLGSQGTVLLARLLWASVLVLIPVPWQAGIYSGNYLILALIFAVPPLAWGWFIRGKNVRELHRMSSLLKWGMLGGLIAIAIGHA